MVSSTLKYRQLETASLPSLTLPSHRDNIPSLSIPSPRRRAHSKDSGLRIIRKVSRKAPCIQVVDGWAYAAVPRILNPPINGILISSLNTNIPSTTTTTNTTSGDVETIGYRRRSKINKWRNRLQYEQYISSSSFNSNSNPNPKTYIPSSNPYTLASSQTHMSTRHLHRIRPRTDSRFPLRRPQNINIRVDVETAVTSSSPSHVLLEKKDSDVVGVSIVEGEVEVFPSILESQAPSHKPGRPLPSIPTVTINNFDRPPRYSSRKIHKDVINPYTTFVIQNPDEQELTKLSCSPYLAPPFKLHHLATHTPTLTSTPISIPMSTTIPTPTPTHSEKLKKIQILRKRLGEDVPASLIFPDLSVPSFHSNNHAALENKTFDRGEDACGARKRRSRSLNGHRCGGGSALMNELRRRRRYGRLDLDLEFDFGEMNLLSLCNFQNTIQSTTNNPTYEDNINNIQVNSIGAQAGEFSITNGLSEVPTRSSSSSGNYSSDLFSYSSTVESEDDDLVLRRGRSRGRSQYQQQQQQQPSGSQVQTGTGARAETRTNEYNLFRYRSYDFADSTKEGAGRGGKRDFNINTGGKATATESTSRLFVRRILSRIRLLSYHHDIGYESETKIY